MAGSDYELLDSGNGRKLERFGSITLARPCSQAIWRPVLSESDWSHLATASFDREEGLNWHGRERLPKRWIVNVDGTKFVLSGTDFGHLGIFPEQRASWAWIKEVVGKSVQRRRKPSVLNLFAYSGGSSLAPAIAGASVCHLDASQSMVEWARDNARENKLENAPIRWIVDDVHKFLAREVRRGRKYDGIVLDPPSFGRGARGEVYKIERDLSKTLDLCRDLLSHTPLFVLLSAHTPGISSVVLQNMLAQTTHGLKGSIDGGEMLLTGAPSVRPVPSGCFARFHNPEA